MPTICQVTILTPPGRAAVASIAVCGEDAVSIVSRFIHRSGKQTFSASRPRQIVFGHWVSRRGGSDTDAREGEGVVAARVATDRVEVHCHGGSVAVKNIVDDLLCAGATLASPTEFQSCEGGDNQSVTQTEAREGLIYATTEKCALILVDQLEGALDCTLHDIGQLISRERWQAAHALCETLLQTWSFGKHLHVPWQVALGGPPNVGKSSLINAILGFQRSIVIDQPGTTRDVVTAYTAIDGWPVELADTAGRRAADCEIEQEGVALGENKMAQADCAIFVSDATHDWVDDFRSYEERRRQTQNSGDTSVLIYVLNKTDLLDDCDTLTKPQRLRLLSDSSQETASAEAFNLVTTSAKTGEGIPEFLELIARRLVPQSLPAGDAVVFTERQNDLLTRLQKCCAQRIAPEALQLLAQLTTLAGPS